MLTKKVFYIDWEMAQNAMKAAAKDGFDSYMVYDPNNKGWNVTFKTLKA